MRIMSGVCLSIYSVVVLKIYMDTFLEPGDGRKRAVGWLLFIIWQSVINISMEVWMPQPGVNVILSISTIGAVGLFSYEGRMWKRVVFPLVFDALWMLTEGLAVFGLGYLSGKVPSLIVSALVSKALLLLAVLGIKFFMKKNGTGKAAYEDGNYLIIFPLTGIVLYYALYVMAEEAGPGKAEVMLWLAVSAVMLISLDLCIYPVYGRLVKELQTRRNSYMYRKQLELYKDQSSLEEAAARETRTIRHDLKQSLIYMREQMH